MTEKGADLLNMNEQHFLINNCPLCGSEIEQMESEQDNFHNYVCPECGLNWQSYVATKAQTELDFSQHWMRYLSQD